MAEGDALGVLRFFSGIFPLPVFVDCHGHGAQNGPTSPFPAMRTMGDASFSPAAGMPQLATNYIATSVNQRSLKRSWPELAPLKIRSVSLLCRPVGRTHLRCDGNQESSGLESGRPSGRTR